MFIILSFNQNELILREIQQGKFYEKNDLLLYFYLVEQYMITKRSMKINNYLFIFVIP